MTIKILVNGARGRMGQTAITAIRQTQDLTLVGEANRGDDLAKMIHTTQAQVVLDLTTASAAYENITTIIAAKAHPVVGTSGLLPEQIKELQQRCAQQRLGGIIVPNFSMGAVLMMRFAQMAAPYFPDVEIIEMHHKAKEDAPSGTAFKTAQMIASARNQTHSLQPSREVIPGSRGALVERIPIHAIRIPGVVATQEVIFGGQGETLSIKDAAISREAYSPGICFACRKVITLDGLIYGLEQLL